MVPIDDSSESDYSQKEQVELKIALEKSEGTGDNVTQDTKVSNLRNTYYEYIGKEPARADFDRILKPDSPLRATITRRIGDRKEIVKLLRAYEELYLPPKRELLKSEFDEKDECDRLGSPYYGNYFNTLLEIKSADSFVEMLTSLEQRIATEEEAQAKHEATQRGITELRQEIKGRDDDRGRETLSLFETAQITIKGIQKEKDIPVSEYGARLGFKLSPDYATQMNDEERADADRALKRFRDKIFEIIPDHKDQVLLLRRLETEEQRIEKELIELYREKIDHEPTDDINERIDRKANERDNASSLLRALRRIF